MGARGLRWLGAAALAALIALAWAQWRADRADAPGTLLNIVPAQVERIEIVRPGAPPQRYARHHGHWWHEGPKPRRVDKDDRLDRIAAIADAPVQRWRPVQELDLHALGLKPSQLILYLNGKRLDYGVMTPFAPQRYVREGDRIAVIPAQYTPQALPARRITLPDTQ